MVDRSINGRRSWDTTLSLSGKNLARGVRFPDCPGLVCFNIRGGIPVLGDVDGQGENRN